MRPRSGAHPGSARVAQPRPIIVPDGPTPEQLTQLYAEVGKRLKAHPDDNLWARFRRIHIQDAIGTHDRRHDTASQLREIARALP